MYLSCNSLIKLQHKECVALDAFSIFHTDLALPYSILRYQFYTLNMKVNITSTRAGLKAVECLIELALSGTLLYPTPVTNKQKGVWRSLVRASWSA